MKTEQKIKTGVIGVGYLGKFHAQKYANMEGVELVGVVDVDAGVAGKIAAECRCRAFSDYRELLPLVDAVSIVVPTSYHHQVALDCIEAGVDILLEKPITTTLAEANDLIQRADARQMIFQVGHLERFNPAVMAMEKFLTVPVFIESSRISTFKNRGVDVDVVLDLMIHDIDIILSIVHSPLKSIQTVGAPVVTATTDIANARLVFENGATANVTASRIARNNIRKMRIFQPGSYINVDFASRKVMTIHLTDEIQANGAPGQEVEVVSFPAGDALRDEIVHFVSSVRNRDQPLVSGHSGRRALEVALQVIAQIQQNQQTEVYQQVAAALKKH
jgi:predicted dehydrogenase